MGPLFRVRRARRTILFAALATAAAAAAIFFSVARASAADGFDTPFAQAVRSSTSSYRLLLWAQKDGYIQSTDYVAGLGVMYTNHDRFDPQDLAHPTVLIFDQAGVLVACEYQFEAASHPSAAFKDVPADAWYDIPRHVHYNLQVEGRTYYEQAEWPTGDAPTAENLRTRKLMPDNGVLLFAFVHPKTRSVIVWAWRPNTDGLFAGENALLP